MRKREPGRTMILPSITTSTFSNSQIWILALVWRNRKISSRNERERRLEIGRWKEGQRVRCVRALRETRERRNINSGRFCGADVRLNGAGHELTHDRLRHDALHLAGHGARCREASETGARRGAAYRGRASRVSGKLRLSLDVPQVPVTRDKSRTESPRAVEWRSRLARRVLRRHRSCTRRKRSGRLVTSYGHSVIRARVCKNFAIPNAQSVQAQTDSETFLFIASRAPARATRRRPAHRASSLGRHGRLTELR